MITEFFKILAICIISTAVCVILKSKNAEYAMLISVAAVICSAFIIIRGILAPINQILEKLSEYSVSAEYFKVALKAVGIGYVSSFAADTCRDSGQAALANGVELAGKCAIFIISLPLSFSLLETAVGFVK